jgi:acyl carrier protein
MQRNEIQQKVIQLIADQLGVAPATINESAALETLGADSLDRVEMIMKLEEEFRIEIRDEDAEKFTTVSQVIDYVAKQQG